MKARSRDRRKYCRFHRDHGHDIEQCIQLKDKIKALIRCSYLEKYKREPLTQPPPNRRPQMTEEAMNNQLTIGVINMITIKLDRRETFDEESMKQPRLHDVITFSEKDARGIQTPHDDAVIVSAIIANYDVKKILIDHESSTDILFYSTFSRMKLLIDQLRKISTPLVGFTGDAITVEGEITLPLTTEIEPQQSTIFIIFTVV
ncbi:uncharacterized protein [Elaeis guineensis]|uniref:Uncharacterized protein LOC105034373 n=1 Tax=Elaeis guineensis var. tenera TaxID=51953 RepID=A0A6I9QE02_ELAGV|nr:uncharacterized protein LOC105034373 [Elaeis guineensis]